ncbi:PAS modulated sigma54 specific transcriptional regulator, Fis family [Candidatus Competibacter denitrificans Run_A_D11]|uniref:PAS modulated sigma54 specific transcriptional regulator, Fis family n=1 Tax=Candidatus Competibacter denitrificans Run_A_D11 TaxID=1400863 RepID=W6MAB6_9GAMM|nr:sigma-54-dependent Fis family transcriptional regulator [Candidatus Competibacter denitrificans]CDI02850.1 PAS modulated sigma54 specific transcriptional regulator, Fis family [Candidatus Competibacter denitrificans Run_A_D11]HAS85428.1 sigma-54-dependent Fis family transcriptional regulator [Candidatus Competibacteraceae bacterium]HRC69844.1 sigma-54-dependent Fis family transcriptional regulator [Candidatus Competibacter denitrificans]
MTDIAQSAPAVLMVDDTPANLGVLYEVLSAAGYSVLVAEDGESALERAAYAQPDLILLDVMMPGIDGFETCRRLKEQPETQAIPIIFMSALSDTVDKIRGLQLGAVDYITKPFQHEEVLARVHTHLTLQQLKRTLAEREARLSALVTSAMDAILTFDADGLITLFNPAAEAMFGCNAAEVLGQPLDTLLAAPLRQVVHDYQRQSEARLWLPEGLQALRGNGQPFPIEATLSRTLVTGQPFYTMILRDIEARQQAEAEFNRLHGLNLYLRDEIQAEHDFEEMIGASTALRAVLQEVEAVAGTQATVLITGETGTGKELIARAIHNRSTRQAKPLIKLNCAAIAASLAESELFGHEKGAFTGALTRKIGRFELANGGTLFLDEVGELPLDLQAKLLRVLQEGEFERVGGSQTLKTDVRVIAATNRDLAQRCREGQFRADLYYRLNVFPVESPALRSRREDIPLLVRHFVQKYAASLGKSIDTVPLATLARLQAYSWPGNVRELQHVIERAVIISRSSTLEFGDWLREPTAEAGPGKVSVLTLEEMEYEHILKALETTSWRVSGEHGAARLLGLKPTTLEARMKKLGIERKRGGFEA